MNYIATKRRPKRIKYTENGSIDKFTTEKVQKKKKKRQKHKRNAREKRWRNKYKSLQSNHTGQCTQNDTPENKVTTTTTSDRMNLIFGVSVSSCVLVLFLRFFLCSICFFFVIYSQKVNEKPKQIPIFRACVCVCLSDVQDHMCGLFLLFFVFFFACVFSSMLCFFSLIHRLYLFNVHNLSY